MANKKTTGATSRPKSKEKKNIVQGVVHIQSTFNNTIVTITDVRGDAVSWSSAGAIGFKGTKKGTPFAAQLAADNAARKAMENGTATRRGFRSWTRIGTRDGYPNASGCRARGVDHQGCDADPAQRLSRAETATRVGTPLAASAVRS